MAQTIRISGRTRLNWLIDAAVFGGAVLASLSGITFLFWTAGYQGGRNPSYQAMLLFARDTWSDLHIWGGVLMIAAVAIHLAVHWSWVKMMSRRAIMSLRNLGSGSKSMLSRGGKINLLVDLAVALSFLITAASGIYFLFAPTGGYQGGRNPGWDPGLLFSRATWDLIHTWAGVIMIIAAIIHFWIHWRWVVNTTRKFFLSLWPQGLWQRGRPVRLPNA